ncbi:glycosyltransferase family 4 protein, partial [Pseudohaliea rubra]
WQAVLAGAGRDADYRDGLVRLEAELDLSGRVRLAGRVAAAELAELYRQASLFALATRYEGHGMVFDEAMTVGLPIVSCRTGAVPDTVAPGAGLLVPVNDPAAFAAALAQLLDDPRRRATMAAASAAAGAALPGWSETVQQIACVLDCVVSRD